MERGRLRERISQMFRASLRSSCSISSRNVVEAVQEPVFVSRRYNGDDDGGVLRGFDRSLSLPPPSLNPLFRRHRRETSAGSPRLSVDCSCRPTTVTRESLKKARKKERRVSEIGAFYEAGGDGEGRTCPPASPVSPSYYCFKQMKEELEREEKRIATKKKKEKEKERRKGKKLLSNSYGFTSSSSEGSDHDDVDDLFSSGEGGGAPRERTSLKERERETEVLFSSMSISSDSSEFYYHSSRRRHSRKKTILRRQQKPRRGDGGRSRHNGWDDGFRPLVSITSSSSSSHSGATRMNEEEAAAMLMEEEEVEVGREGFAVEQQSSDPYADFMSSMLEMIVEKQMFGARDLEHLLRRYLALNSPCHHPIILEVFSEIWETLFSN